MKVSYSKTFTVILKDNLDLKGSSITSKNHYLATCTSTISFSKVQNWGVIFFQTFRMENKRQQQNLKVNSMSESSSTLGKPNIWSLQALYIPLSIADVTKIDACIFVEAIDNRKRLKSIN